VEVDGILISKVEDGQRERLSVEVVYDGGFPKGGPFKSGRTSLEEMLRLFAEGSFVVRSVGSVDRGFARDLVRCRHC
jgi:hypothetical protein